MPSNCSFASDTSAGRDRIACWGLLVCWIFCPPLPLPLSSTIHRKKKKKKNQKQKQKIAYAQPQKKIQKTTMLQKIRFCLHIPLLSRCCWYLGFYTWVSVSQSVTLYFLCPRLGLASRFRFFLVLLFNLLLSLCLRDDNDNDNDNDGGIFSSNSVEFPLSRPSR